MFHSISHLFLHRKVPKSISKIGWRSWPGWSLGSANMACDAIPPQRIKLSGCLQQALSLERRPEIQSLLMQSFYSRLNNYV